VSDQPFRIPNRTGIASARLRIRDLSRSLGFYQDVIGLRPVGGEAGTAALSAAGTGPAMFVLVEDRDAPAPAPRTTGLFHVAIRVPTRRALALSVTRVLLRWRIDGLADHGVSEAAYLTDPDGNGIEIYADRPPETWPFANGQVEMITARLPLDPLMRELEPPAEWSGIDGGAEIGHIHLRVSNLARAEAFYGGVLGFDVTQRTFPGALFMSAGGYHHHIGLNVWSSAGGSRPAANAIGLVSYSVALPDAAVLETLRARLEAAGSPVQPATGGGIQTEDPDGTAVRLVAV